VVLLLGLNLNGSVVTIAGTAPTTSGFRAAGIVGPIQVRTGLLIAGYTAMAAMCWLKATGGSFSPLPQQA
jgi:hypothetical protein